MGMKSVLFGSVLIGFCVYLALMPPLPFTRPVTNNGSSATEFVPVVKIFDLPRVTRVTEEDLMEMVKNQKKLLEETSTDNLTEQETIK